VKSPCILLIGDERQHPENGRLLLYHHKKVTAHPVTPVPNSRRSGVALTPVGYLDGGQLGSYLVHHVRLGAPVMQDT
jgi:hypothetical protein